ncbi:Solute carrier family 22 member 8 [Armadillidium vulgare]|nr:Solute carrier family 22 member 8 [Armadillidium vulgare]
MVVNGVTELPAYTVSVPIRLGYRPSELATLSPGLDLIIAPYITDSLGSIYPWIPSVIFGSLSFVAGFASIFIPETLNKNLHETIVDLEEEARAMKRKETKKISRRYSILKSLWSFERRMILIKCKEKI